MTADQFVCIGIDPGGISGVAVVGMSSVLDAWQGETDEAVVKAVRWARARRDYVLTIAIEAPHIAMMKRPGAQVATPLNPQSSLSVAWDGGQFRGAMLVAGIQMHRIWVPQPSEWRKEAHVSGRKREEQEASARVLAGAMTGVHYTKATTHTAEAILIAQAALQRATREQFGERNVQRDPT